MRTFLGLALLSLITMLTLQAHATPHYIPGGVYSTDDTNGHIALGTSALPATGAAVDLSKNTGSIILPVGTTTQRPTGVNGMLRYNSDSSGSVEGFIGGSWQPLAAVGGGVTSFTGDGLFLNNSVSTGAVTATKASIAANTVIGNATSGSAVPTATATPIVSGASTAASFNATTPTTGYQLNGANAINFPANDTTAGASIAIGSSAMPTLPASAAFGNTAIGYQVLSGTMTTNATQNTGVGYQAVKAVTTAQGVTGVGYQAAGSTTTGFFNTAVGYLALSQASTSNTNTAMGVQSLQRVTITGAGNTAVGYNSGPHISTGTGNTIIGAGVDLSTITTGSQNTVLGYQVATTTLTTGSSNILIGTSNGVTTPVAGTSNYLNIGNMFVGDVAHGTLIFEGPTSSLGSCGGSPALKTGSNDIMGEVTVGSATTSCVVNFSNTKNSVPACIVTSKSTLAAFGYSVSTTALTVTATTLGGDVVDYFCAGVSTTTNPTP